MTNCRVYTLVSRRLLYLTFCLEASNMGKPVVQLWYRVTVAFSRWMSVDHTNSSTSNGWMQLWHDNTVTL
ncbi:hypothetical protein CISIN_1g035277mg [Citrus sinensis]|uniref:Uncharacterized protein n=1 Tax=Citrus sinensis TaxID=2711 RepID=A0A067EH30_CITSI|nr:hypothetical protein CISIN_1g035277mg [Citrus sinensis]